MSNMTAEQQLDPYAWYAQMRTSQPITFIESQNAWQVFRYDDVMRVMSDYATFAEAFVSRSGGDASHDPMSHSLIALDPPRHRQLRSLVTQAFSPRSVAKLADRITFIVNQQLDRVAPTGRMDVIEDLSYPLPVIVIAELLGIPQEDRARFKAWSDAIVGANVEVTGDPMAEMGAYFTDMIQKRRAEAKDDLISALLAAQIDGVHLTQLELLGFCILLLAAGNETITNLIGNAILCFDDHPEVMDQLRANPARMPGAIEEVLRYRSPVQLMYRRAVSDVTIGDQQIAAGQMVVATLGSANRDPSQFPNPDVFDMQRTPNQHMAFGHGVHFCLGAPLARLESKIALTIMLDRFQNIRRDREIPLELTGSAFVYGVKHLPIAFETRQG
jgi:cytochrome P450